MLTDYGTVRLLVALTNAAYNDYVNGGLLLKHSEYEVNSGVIKLLKVNNRKPTSKEKNLVKYYAWSLMYFEDTNWGKYLMRKGDEAIRAGERRGIKKKGDRK